MDCTAAAHRLTVGVPATVEHDSHRDGSLGRGDGDGGTGSGGHSNNGEHSKWVAETTQVRVADSPFTVYLSASCESLADN